MSKLPLRVLTLVSAIICLGSLGLMGRSFSRADILRLPIGQSGGCWATIIYGQLRLWDPDEPLGFAHYVQDAAASNSSYWRTLSGMPWLGIAWNGRAGPNAMILPLWLVPLLTAILPVRWWRAHRRGGARGFEVEPAATA